MSSSESVNPELVEETKQQIRGLVNEIADLTKSDVPESEFYEQFLSRVVLALAANGGVVWDASDGRFQIGYEIGLRDSGVLADEDRQRQHGKLLRRVVESGEPILVPPNSGSDDEELGANPTEQLLVLCALRTDQDVHGIVEIFQRPGAAANTQRGYLRFLMQVCDLAEDYLTRRSLRKYGDRQTLWNLVEQFTRLAHATLDPTLSAYAIANEGRRLIECDRVSVAVMRGGRVKIQSVSGQDTFDKRSNAIVLLQKLANAVVRQGEPVWYSGDTTDMPPQVEEAVQDYVDESHSKTVGVIPLRREKEVDESQADERHTLEPIVGALIVEQIEDARAREGMSQRVDVVARHGAAALANAVEHNNLFLMPLWRSIGKAKWVVRARTLPKTVTIAIAATALIAALCIIPSDYTLEGKGVLQPQLRSEIFAEADGTILQELPFDENDVVRKGDVLAVIDDRQLEQQISEYRKQFAETVEGLNSVRMQIAQIVGDPQEEAKLHGQRRELEERLAKTQIQLALFEEEKQRLTVVSPINGQIETPQVKRLLRNRPVQRGQLLMTVSDRTQDWEMEVSMSEKRMGDITRRYEEYKEARKNDPNAERIKVSYILTSHPDTSFHDQIEMVGEIVEVAGEEGTIVRIRVPMDAKNREEIEKLHALNPGTTVTAKVFCGREPIGYVWFHEVLDFVSRVMFRYF